MSSSPPSPPAAAASGCPVDHSQFSGGRPNSPMLTPPKSEALVCDSASLDTPTHPMPTLPRSSPGQCPVDHTKFSKPNPHSPQPHTSQPIAGPAIVGDVFPDSTPQPDQKSALSTAPVASTIPKGGADQSPDATWIFPSPQRFFNAMKKKGWNPNEPDMAWVVSIHNTVNEQTWRKVLEYERFHSCPNPKLIRFKGRPSDLSPKARMLSWIGYVAPFDRHDWVVDRCGTEVRYVIDFYSGGNGGMDMPGMPTAIHLDVRPALTPMGAIDRIRWQFNKWFGGDK